MYVNGKLNRLVVKSLLPHLSAIVSGEWEKEKTIERVEKSSDEEASEARAKVLRRLKRKAAAVRKRKSNLWNKIESAVQAANVSDMDLSQTANRIAAELVRARLDRVSGIGSRTPIWTLDMVESAAGELLRKEWSPEHRARCESLSKCLEQHVDEAADRALKMKKTKVRSDPSLPSYEPRGYKDSRKCSFAEEWRKADEREDLAWFRRGVYTIVKRSKRDRSKPLLQIGRAHV